MKSKTPSSVITDGDLAMRNTIRKVFPNAQHKLCAWHLLRNATSNVGIPDFMAYFKRCMLSDWDVAEFEQRWNNMLSMFGLEDNTWLREMYEKKNMWATTYIRGQFFAGIRTTSRCKALYCHLGKFIHSRINLTEFMQQFHRFLTYFRFREVEVDFRSVHGEPVLQTNFHTLESAVLNKSISNEGGQKVRRLLFVGLTLMAHVTWDSHLIARYATLLELCRELSELASHDDDDYNHIVYLVTNELHKLRRKNGVAGGGRHCGICGASGHNRRSCPIGRQNVEMTPSTSRHPFVGEDEGSFYHNNNLNSGLDSSQLHEQPHMFAYSTTQDVDGGQ
ncbi:Zinc finger, CCHC-type [Sesbania bispinosa]|nr:Zinc finger, CCHC-type [Sesbania bispinosa]